MEKIYGHNIDNLGHFISEISAGGNKSMGASLTLRYVTKRNLSKIIAFEYKVPLPEELLGYLNRQYDLVTDTFQYEFKYWKHFGGESSKSAVMEFARDVVLHIDDNFVRLRWVISNDVKNYRYAIEQMMLDTVKNNQVQQALIKKGISIEEAQNRIQNALSKGLLEFF